MQERKTIPNNTKGEKGNKHFHLHEWCERTLLVSDVTWFTEVTLTTTLSIVEDVLISEEFKILWNFILLAGLHGSFPEPAKGF